LLSQPLPQQLLPQPFPQPFPQPWLQLQDQNRMKRIRRIQIQQLLLLLEQNMV